MKNQFRTLDEDEVEFLDSVLESTRAKEQAVKEETRSELEAFRKRQGQVDREDDGGEAPREDTGQQSPPTESAPWKAVQKKRKRVQNTRPDAGAKVRKASTDDTAHTASPPKTASKDEVGHKAPPSASPPAPKSALLGLASYESDDD